MLRSGSNLCSTTLFDLKSTCFKMQWNLDISVRSKQNSWAWHMDLLSCFFFFFWYMRWDPGLHTCYAGSLPHPLHDLKYYYFLVYVCMVCGCGDAPASPQLGNQSTALLLYYVRTLRLYVRLWVCVRGHTQGTCAGQKTYFVSLFSSSTIWRVGIEFRLPG